MPKKKPSAPSASSDPASKPLLTVAQSFDLRFSPDSRRVAATTGGRVWDLSSGQEVLKCKVPPDAMGLQFSPDGSCLAAVATGGVISIYDSASGAVVRKIKTGGCGELTYDPSGQWIATGNDETGLSLWNVATGDLVQRATLEGNFPWGIGWYPGRALWVHTSDANSTVLLTFDKKLKRQMETNLKRPAEHVVPLPKVKHGIVATHGKQLLILVGAKVVRQVKLKVARVVSLTVSADGKWIAVMAADAQDKFLLFDTKELALRAQRETAEGMFASFSPNSKLVSIATSKKGEVWEVARLVEAGS